MDPAEVARTLPLAALFEHEPHVYLYVKDRDSRFLHVNAAWLRMRGFNAVADVVGLNDFDLHPPHLAERYVAEDRRVMSAGRTLPNQVWLVPAGKGRLRWFLSTKTPLFDASGAVWGLAGVMRDYEAAGEVARPNRRLQDVLSYVARNYAERLAVPDLAERAGLSVSQFERNFKRVFGMTPRQYIQRVRISAACEQLVASDRPAGDVALECGFYDQSYFTKQFRRFLGETPSAYRRRNRDLAPSGRR